MFKFSESLVQAKFSILIECLNLNHTDLPFPQQIAGFPTVITIADRVQSDDDTAPIEIAKQSTAHLDVLLHYSGKGRDISDFQIFLDTAEKQGIQNLLLLSGDKLKKHQFGQNDTHRRTRYLESVNAVIEAKQRTSFNIGVALNPFKYTTAETDAQYYKLQKKIKAGADFIITQLGYDLDALKHAKEFLKQHQYEQSIFACVMPLTLSRAQFMLKAQVPGIIIPEHIVSTLKKEVEVSLEDAEAHVYERCALQILICQYLGYAGVHLSACHQMKSLKKLEHALLFYQHFSLEQCYQAWNRLWNITTLEQLKPNLTNVQSTTLDSAPFEQVMKYKSMHLMHDVFFASNFAKKLGGSFFKAKIWDRPKAQDVLLKTEFASKHNVVGCESCGQCRLAETLYICPETCPKGLANGPCGGTQFDRCEFGDRECIHSVKARLAKTVLETDILKSALIATVPIEVRQSSSWKNWFKAEHG